MFLNPYKTVDKHGNRLPHWQQREVMIFATWRLADSLPQVKLDQWRSERDAWLAQHLPPWDDEAAAEYHEQFTERIDAWLDAGEGSCVLRDPALARIVAAALLHFEGVRYVMDSFVVMPNHVHVLFQPLMPHSLEEIMHSWKRFTARAINLALGLTGALWQERYWDRLLRDEVHLVKSREYIAENPAKARLREDEHVLWSKGDGVCNAVNSI